MQQGLIISIVGVDPDFLLIHIRAANAMFSGSTTIYAGLRELGEFAKRIAGFPTTPVDERSYEFGSPDPAFAGGYCRVRFRCIDRAGHSRVDISIQGDEPDDPASADFSFFPPGFLAAYLLRMLPAVRLTLLDFSAPMQDLARARLGPSATHVSFVERSFKEPGWSQGLGRFDAVITNQAVHELRHKRYAASLHAAVKDVLKAGGLYLVSDHFFGDGGLPNDQLYMTVAEQRDVLLTAGFSDVQRVATAGTLVMHRATAG
jgi:SAM-dependent methyltransferase